MGHKLKGPEDAYSVLRMRTGQTFADFYFGGCLFNRQIAKIVRTATRISCCTVYIIALVTNRPNSRRKSGEAMAAALLNLH